MYDTESVSLDIENPRLYQTLQWLNNEVAKFVKAKRITELSLKELDIKI